MHNKISGVFRVSESEAELRRPLVCRMQQVVHERVVYPKAKGTMAECPSLSKTILLHVSNVTMFRAKQKSVVLS